jgi:hypothetical protein
MLWVLIKFMARCTRYNIMWQFVSDLQQICGFLQVLRFPPLIKLDITEILLKVVLNTIPLTLTPFKPIIRCAKSWNTELNMLLSLE